jgi:Short C-terminal domain
VRAWAFAFPLFFVGLGGAFAALAYADQPAGAALTFWIMAASFVGSGLLVLAVYLLIGRSVARAGRLRRTGKQAWATVERIEDTGVTVNDNPRVHLWLKVRPEGEREFEIEGKRVVSRLSIPPAGSSILIRYEPDDPGGFVFDDRAGAGAPVAPAGLEQAVRQALTAKGVTGARQDEAVRKALEGAAAGSSVVDLREYTQADEAEPAADPVEQLERLAKLRDSGVLSEGEFAVAKTKLLADL